MRRIWIRTQRALAGSSGRSGLLLAVEDERGRIGLGEASPLPGYSPDDLPSCQAALAGLDASALGALTADGTELGPALRAASAVIPERLPAARHALETALLDLLAQAQGAPLWALLARAVGRRDVPSLVPLAVLIDGPNPVGAARSAVERGARTIKLKLGRRAFSEELACIVALRAALGPAIQLRLDVNRRWRGSEALAQLAALAHLRPELVEESVCAAELGAVAGSPVPLALDESLQDPLVLEDIEPWLTRSRIAALVLKPMALGGLSRCLELARWASDRGLDAIVSHAFDGPVALAAAAHLALAVGSPDRAAGLGPHTGLASWPRIDLPIVRAAHIVADDAPGIGLGLRSLAA
jgi:o-succinylbenzoate synthase